MGDPPTKTGGDALAAVAAELWIAKLDALAVVLADLESCEPLCPAGELDGFEPARRAARQLLRRLIARTFGRSFATAAFAAGQHGKPHVPGLPGDFNLSHTVSQDAGGVALIGIARAGSIGVDLEQSRIVRLDARRRSLIAEAAIRAAGGAGLPCDDDARILQAWVRLEAWGKAEGRGIGRTLTHFGVWGRGDAALYDGNGQSPALTVFDVDAGPGLWGAAAVPYGSRPPALHIIPTDPTAARQLLAGTLVGG